MSGELVVGIDPGLSGAIAALTREGAIVALADTPVLHVAGSRRVLSLAALSHLLRGIDPSRALLERQSARPGEGVVSSFTTGRGFGELLGVLAALGIPHDDILPQSWRRIIGLPPGSDKDASRLLAIRSWPEARQDLKLAKHHGRAEALLIAEVARRRHFIGDRVPLRVLPARLLTGNASCDMTPGNASDIRATCTAHTGCEAHGIPRCGICKPCASKADAPT
ncbi:MAG: hypothetical protein HT579_11845 [Candidatus Accumulibacter similis]|nr:MAG: hypothetical protein HT579_11845 [Candidatus Accumulibacter similis]